MCGGESAEPRPLPVFWFTRDVSGGGVGVFPTANESTQVKLGVDKSSNWMYSDRRKLCGRSGEEKKI